MNKIKEQFINELKDVKTMEQANELRVKYMGKKGLVTALMVQLKDAEDKKAFGQELNILKGFVNTELAKVLEVLNEQKIDQELQMSKIDVTFEKTTNLIGKQNILVKTGRDIENIFVNMGFEIAIGPEVESDYHNFEALNLPATHPARDMQDTFYINPELLLRTHTSNIQSRTLSANPNKELKIICPGKVYRRDDDDATHSHQFMQTEGLMVIKKDSPNEGSLQTLKTVLTIFVNQIFERDDLKIRMRSSYFPFTEPSVEVDITCTSCGGHGCSMCKQTGFIEVLGAGIIHKNVLAKAGYDSDLYYGFAFGIGVERIAILKYNIEDIRNFYTNDMRFISQF